MFEDSVLERGEVALQLIILPRRLSGSYRETS
jgi:hypothetical protein